MVNQFEYLKSFEAVLNDIEQKIWMQDGATCHTTNRVLDFLKSKFADRIISRRTAIPWPACSPDINPLDYSFWGMCEQEIIKKKPKTLKEMREVVDNFSTPLDADFVRRNVLKRAKLCIQEQGGHFEHLMNTPEE